jgi:hypothetical protein
MWRIGGLLGKGIVIAIAVFIIGEAIVKTHSKYSEEKNKHQKDKIILEQMKKRIVRIDRLDDNLGEMAARFQKYLDDFKEEGSK